MQCPHLSKESKSLCTKMLEANIKDYLTAFDLKYFCSANPIYCYYYRCSTEQDAPKNQTIGQEKLRPPKQPQMARETWITIKELQSKNNPNP